MSGIWVELFSILAGLIVPIVIDLLFGATPLRLSVSSIRRAIENARLRSKRESASKTETAQPSGGFERLSPLLDPVDVLSAQRRVSSCNSHQLLSLLALESTERARRIERRASVFILSGVVIAIGGLIAFYILYKTSPQSKDFSEHILSILPNFGILFFIEFVALFCLRQYRPTIDEFRYFESLARSREDALIALKLVYERGDTPSGSELISSARIFSSGGKLGKDESTELIETRKLHRDELLVAEKALDVVGVLGRRNGNKNSKEG